MASQAIGSLFVALGLDTAAFSAGIKQAQAGIGKFASKLQNVGAGLTAAVTVPLAGLATGAQAAAKSLSELANQAAVAGLDPQRFKIMAMAAEDYGIQQEKLADILKDVNDKVGDFLSTGGGEMKDFFEKIAPKVGVTADQFRNLNSADALALYVDTLQKAGLSQAEMTFYMEAIADEATALVPLFADNAKALKAMEAEATRLGLKLDGDLIGAAKATERQFRITKDVLGIQFQQALVQMAPAVSQLMAAIVPLVQKLADVVTWAAQAFASLSPEAQTFAAGAVAVAAALGPLMMGIGATIPIITGLATAFGALAAALWANPVVAIIGAIALGATLIYTYWDDIVPFFTGLWEQVKATFDAAWQGIKAGVGLAWEGIKTYFSDYTLIGIVITNWDQIKAAIGAALDGIVQWHKDAFNSIIAFIQGLPERFIQLGADIINGLWNGIKGRWDAMISDITSLADGLPDFIKGPLGIHSPSRVMMEIGGWITEGLGIGIQDGTSGVAGAMDGIAETVKEGGEKTLTIAQQIGDKLKSTLSGWIVNGGSLGDALRGGASSLLSGWASSLADKAIGGLLDFIPFFANGTNFAPGGLARVNERGGEIMNLPRGTQVIPHDISKRMADKAGSGMGALAISVSVDQGGGLKAFVRNEAGQIVAQSQPVTVQRAVQATGKTMGRTKQFGGRL